MLNISFIGRNYYRMIQGAGTTGLAVSAFFLVFNTFGIWKQSLEYYSIPLIPFVVAGFFGLFALYWGSGFIWEKIGLYREVQSHMNMEVNPQWVHAYRVLTDLETKFLKEQPK
jgi:hypothetical protein